MRISRRMGICAWQGFGQNSFTYTGKSRYTDEGSGDWRLELLTSGTLTLRRSVAADVFLTLAVGATEPSEMAASLEEGDVYIYCPTMAG